MTEPADKLTPELSKIFHIATLTSSSTQKYQVLSLPPLLLVVPHISASKLKK